MLNNKSPCQTLTTTVITALLALLLFLGSPPPPPPPTVLSFSRFSFIQVFMIIIGQISIQSLTTHCDFFQFTLTLLAKVFVGNKSGLKQSVTETSLISFRNKFERQTFLCLACPLQLGFKILLVVKIFISISTVTSFLLDHATV